MTHPIGRTNIEPHQGLDAQAVPYQPKVHKTAWSGVRKIIPVQVRQRLLSVRAWPRTIAAVSDLESFRQYRRLENTTTCWSANEDVVRIRLRPLGGAAVWLRPRTADRYALRGTFSDVFHRPPPQLKTESIRVIWDLGANIGLTMSDLAYRYPGARVIGVELDPDNAALCRRNLAPWADRCRLVEAAVWCEDGELEYRRDPGMEQGFRIGPVARSPTNARALSLSLNTLLSQTPDRPVDFAKIDIEGAEQEVLRRNTEWAAAVRSIKVEVHEPYSVADCVHDLANLGFTASVDSRHPACVAGVRESAPVSTVSTRSPASSAASAADSKGTRS